MTPAEKEQNKKETRALLEGFWPAAFNFDNPQPLKIGITEELVADAKKRGLPFPYEVIKAAVALYTSRKKYYRALSNGRERIDLEGKPTGKPQENERIWAKILLRKKIRQEKREARERAMIQEQGD